MNEKILAIEDLTVSFDGFKALNNLNFSMDTGELRVIIGPNGAGKTTFLDVITGKVQPTEGRVLFKGRNLKKISEHKIARLGIGRKFQTPRVFLNLTVRENLDLVCNRQKNVWATLLGKSSKNEQRTVAGLLETIGLVAQADLPASLLSHGEKQRLEIGMLVAQSPDLLLVDEPVAGLTDEETENVGNLLLALAESHSIIVIEHDMEFVRQIARQVTVLHQGSVLCEGNMEQIQNDPKVIEVYLGKETSLNTEQIIILRIAAAMAWADNNIAPVQQEVILSRLSRQFAETPEEQQDLREELKNYLGTDIPLTELVPQLTTQAEKEQVLQLSYEIISSNLINEPESILYQELLQLLDLPPKIVAEIEAEVNQGKHLGNVYSLTEQQMLILQIAASMAWADGNFSPEELEIILSRLSVQFARHEADQESLCKELQNYLLKDIPLVELVPKLTHIDDQEMVLRLAYEIIIQNGINAQEARAYRQLKDLLKLPTEFVSQVEAEIEARTQ